jgi:hypothetical protein
MFHEGLLLIPNPQDKTYIVLVPISGSDDNGLVVDKRGCFEIWSLPHTNWEITELCWQPTAERLILLGHTRLIKLLFHAAAAAAMSR